MARLSDPAGHPDDVAGLLAVASWWSQPRRTSSRVWVRRKPTGKVSIPAARSRASDPARLLDR